MTSIEVRPGISFEELDSACKAVLAAKPKRSKERTWPELVALVIACLTMGLLAQWRPTRLASWMALGFVAIFAFAGKLSTKVRHFHAMQGFYAEEAAMLNDQQLTLDEEGVSCQRSSGSVSIRYRWPAFVGRIDLPDALLFLPSPNTFVRVSKQGLGPEQLALIDQWSAGVPRAPGKKSTP